ncbi:hypothetical protein AB1046_02720 [Promicromonospora sp. Populi]|uniref:hypothetical protein n=1 Tax=Promicromonospora sp. Populi TaxID=3239420 RepID=UPI0034E2C18A
MTVAAATASTSVAATGSVAATVTVTEDTAISGSVTRSGKPVAGADVLVVAWPESKVLEALPDDTEVPMYTVANIKTDIEGNYAVPLDVSALPPDLVSDGGQVDVDVMVADATSQMQRSVSLASASSLSGGRWIAAMDTEAVTSGDDVEGVSMTFDLDTGAVTDSTMPWTEQVDDQGVELTEAAAAEALRSEVTARVSIDTWLANRVSEASVVPLDECVAVGTGTYQSNRRENFVIARGVTNAKVTVDQNSNSTHTVGVAYKTSTVWKAGGTQTKTWSNSAQQSGIAGTRMYYDHVRYRFYDNPCGVGYTDFWRPNNGQELLAGYVVVDALNYNNCRAHGNGYSYTKEEGKNTTYSTGMDLEQVNVSAQSGWGSATQLRWSWTGQAKLCWSSADAGPEGSARVITKP